MFVYVRYIAIACVVLGSAVTLLLSTFFADKAREELYSSTMQKHVMLTKSVASGLWRQYAPLTVRYIRTAGGAMVPVPVDTTGFPTHATQFLQQYDVARIGLYAFKGSDLYQLAGTTGQPWKDSTGTDVGLIDTPKIAQGRSVSRHVNASVNGRPARLLQTIIPIPRANAQGERVAECLQHVNPPPDCVPEVFLDIVSDLAPALDRINQARWLFAGASVGLFIIVGLIVLITVGRAETIIAKQHEVNLELTAAAAAAEAQSRDKSMFLANISHELRTPLNAIIGFSEIIKNEGRSNLPKEHQEYIDDIHASGKHLLALINDILDYSKAEAGKLQIEYSEVDMLKLTRNSMRMVLPRAEESQVTLVENLPKESLVITTDVKKLKQVMLNLLSNAVKFTPAGGEVRVSVWEDIVTKDMVCEVKDSGIGIAPKDISRVMMPFVQVDSTLARRFEGTGLGLPLSKKFVESMGGQFFIESEVNKGTTITLRLPVKPAYNAPVAHEESDVETKST